MVVETPLEPPRVPLESSVEVEREPVASQPESEVEEPAAQVVSDRDTELRVALEELGRIADRSLEGRFDPGAMLATALLVAAHEVGAPDPEPDFAGRVQLPIEGLPEGFEAGLYVTKPNSSQQRVLSLEIRLPRETPLAHGNYERAGPKVTLTTWTSEEGEFKHINIGTDFETERRVGALMQDPPDMLFGFTLRTSLADPSAWKLTASGLREIEGTREADGSHRQKSAQWEVPQVLDGRPWPQLEEMTRLNQRLHELLASAKARSAR